MSAQEAVDEKGQSKKGRDFASFLIAACARFTGVCGRLGESSLLLSAFLLGALAACPDTSKTGANSRSLNAALRWFHQDVML
ncbi:hypothetical protein [uncultured Ottowia sp.]|uniref:hypothetical protein n=1 Tax=uncultured Ottowia sp. TaxID=543067 RepID=UPI002598A861|nr:hypothetical protein [uncultured Ottowia sp.]